MKFGKLLAQDHMVLTPAALIILLPVLRLPHVKKIVCTYRYIAKTIFGPNMSSVLPILQNYGSHYEYRG